MLDFGGHDFTSNKGTTPPRSRSDLKSALQPQQQLDYLNLGSSLPRLPTKVLNLKQSLDKNSLPTVFSVRSQNSSQEIILLPVNTENTPTMKKSPFSLPKKE